ncbi:MAG TPA: class II fructose-bisphosphate aldolase [Mycobacteriales bacterium]|nr:class II fructose-bisphosphate aldolase [Mycobacteriales bacterium]
MPVANPETYAEMIDRAKAGGFAYPAINVTSSATLNAALRGFADAESDGIIQVSWGGAEFASGASIKDMVTGAVAIAEYTKIVAENYPIRVGLHTDHCPPDKLAGFMRPLLELSIERVKAGGDPIFGSHMWDGSSIDLEDNLKTADELFAMSIEAHTIMELEIGVVGGEEDGISNEKSEKLYTSPKDMERVVDVLGAPGERGRYLLAAVFGNVHGVYKPGSVELRPTILKLGQEHVGAKLGKDNPLDLVFHGGSGSMLDEIRETLGYGVVKMNVDTDTQYAYTRPVVDHVMKNYDGVLKVDGDVGNKKAYDPRAWGRAAEAGMAARVTQACADLKSTGTRLT